MFICRLFHNFLDVNNIVTLNGANVLCSKKNVHIRRQCNIAWFIVRVGLGPCFLAECRMRRLNQASFVLL